MSTAATAQTTPPPANVVEEFLGIVRGQLTTAAESLFDGYGCPLTFTASAEETDEAFELSLGSVIGFTSAHVRGVLAIAIDGDLAVRMNPVPEAANDPDATKDWIGELANQLLGRLKNRLLGVGVELQLSTPLIVEGEHLRLGVNQARAMRLLFSNDENQAQVWWDAEIDSELVLGEPEEEAQAEGDMLLF